MEQWGDRKLDDGASDYDDDEPPPLDDVEEWEPTENHGQPIDHLPFGSMHALIAGGHIFHFDEVGIHAGDLLLPLPPPSSFCIGRPSFFFLEAALRRVKRLNKGHRM